LWTLAVLAMTASVAQAVDTDLSHGVFIFHHDPTIVFSEYPGGWCEYYLNNYAINSCEQQNPSIMTYGSPTNLRVWFLISAWSENKTWCATEFGLGNYSADALIIASGGYGACAPGSTLEIPTDNWPDPNSGTVIATTDTPWSGNFVPVYYFTGYVYDGSGPGTVQLTASPATQFVGWVNCQTPPIEYDNTDCLPALGYMMDGVECCPGAGPAQGACCFPLGDSCEVLTQADCLSSGGTYLGDGTSCTPNDCPVVWACCVGEVCSMETSEDCDGLGGDFLGEGFDCDPNPCQGEPESACCFAGGACSMLTNDDCLAQGGVPHPGASCTPTNPCPVVWACCSENVCTMLTEEECDDGGAPPWMTWFENRTCDDPPPTGIDCLLPAERISWGKIKSIYRSN
jgi:hypothetical protein